LLPTFSSGTTLRTMRRGQSVRPSADRRSRLSLWWVRETAWRCGSPVACWPRRPLRMARLRAPKHEQVRLKLTLSHANSGAHPPTQALSPMRPVA
jgi:hypothetical protein